MTQGVRGTSLGFWVTTNGGASWHWPAGFISIAATTTNDVTQMSVDPTDFNHVIVVSHSTWTGYSNAGIMETHDGGATFVAHPPVPSWSSGSLALNFLYDPASGQGDSNTYLVGDWTSNGMWKTKDDGNTFTQVTTLAASHGGGGRALAVDQRCVGSPGPGGAPAFAFDDELHVVPPAGTGPANGAVLSLSVTLLHAPGRAQGRGGGGGGGFGAPSSAATAELPLFEEGRPVAGGDRLLPLRSACGSATGWLRVRVRKRAGAVGLGDDPRLLQLRALLAALEPGPPRALSAHRALLGAAVCAARRLRLAAPAELAEGAGDVLLRLFGLFATLCVDLCAPCRAADAVLAAAVTAVLVARRGEGGASAPARPLRASCRLALSRTADRFGTGFYGPLMQALRRMVDTAAGRQPGGCGPSEVLAAGDVLFVIADAAARRPSAQEDVHLFLESVVRFCDSPPGCDSGAAVQAAATAGEAALRRRLEERVVATAVRLFERGAAVGGDLGPPLRFAVGYCRAATGRARRLALLRDLAAHPGWTAFNLSSATPALPIPDLTPSDPRPPAPEPPPAPQLSAGQLQQGLLVELLLREVAWEWRGMTSANYPDDGDRTLQSSRLGVRAGARARAVRAGSDRAATKILAQLLSASVASSGGGGCIVANHVDGQAEAATRDAMTALYLPFTTWLVRHSGVLLRRRNRHTRALASCFVGLVPGFGPEWRIGIGSGAWEQMCKAGCGLPAVLATLGRCLWVLHTRPDAPRAVLLERRRNSVSAWLRGTGDKCVEADLSASYASWSAEQSSRQSGHGSAVFSPRAIRASDASTAAGAAAAAAARGSATAIRALQLWGGGDICLLRRAWDRLRVHAAGERALRTDVALDAAILTALNFVEQLLATPAPNPVLGKLCRTSLCRARLVLHRCVRLAAAQATVCRSIYVVTRAMLAHGSGFRRAMLESPCRGHGSAGPDGCGAKKSGYLAYSAEGGASDEDDNNYFSAGYATTGQSDQKGRFRQGCHAGALLQAVLERMGSSEAPVQSAAVLALAVFFQAPQSSDHSLSALADSRPETSSAIFLEEDNEHCEQLQQQAMAEALAYAAEEAEDGALQRLHAGLARIALIIATGGIMPRFGSCPGGLCPPGMVEPDLETSGWIATPPDDGRGRYLVMHRAAVNSASARTMKISVSPQNGFDRADYNSQGTALNAGVAEFLSDCGKFVELYAELRELGEGICLSDEIADAMDRLVEAHEAQPALQALWLHKLCRFHERHGAIAAAAQCCADLAALAEREISVRHAITTDHPPSSHSFASTGAKECLTPLSAARTERLRAAVTASSQHGSAWWRGDLFSGEYLLHCHEMAGSALLSAGRPRDAYAHHRRIISLLEEAQAWSALRARLSAAEGAVLAMTEEDSIAGMDGGRPGPIYFRVALAGGGINGGNGGEYVYEAPQYTQIADFQDELRNQLAALLLHSSRPRSSSNCNQCSSEARDFCAAPATGGAAQRNVIVLDNSRDIWELARLDLENLYLQVTYLQHGTGPDGAKSESQLIVGMPVGSSLVSLPLSSSLPAEAPPPPCGGAWFYYDLPLREDGTIGHAATLEQQWKLRVLLAVSHPFPHRTRRQKVAARALLRLSPLVLAAEDLDAQTARIRTACHLADTAAADTIRPSLETASNRRAFCASPRTIESSLETCSRQLTGKKTKVAVTSNSSELLRLLAGSLLAQVNVGPAHLLNVVIPAAVTALAQTAKQHVSHNPGPGFGGRLGSLSEKDIEAQVMKVGTAMDRFVAACDEGLHTLCRTQKLERSIAGCYGTTIECFQDEEMLKMLQESLSVLSLRNKTLTLNDLLVESGRKRSTVTTISTNIN